jgi:hypothetical protein
VGRKEGIFFTCAQDTVRLGNTEDAQHHCCGAAGRPAEGAPPAIAQLATVVTVKRCVEMDGVDEQILLAASIIERGVGKGELFFYLLSFSDSGLVILTNKRQINRRKSI